MIVLNFNCLPLPLDETFGKISYLNIGISPGRELKKFFYIVGYNPKFFSTFLNLNNCVQKNFSAK
jgi:hypothetical protein